MQIIMGRSQKTYGFIWWETLLDGRRKAATSVVGGDGFGIPSVVIEIGSTRCVDNEILHYGYENTRHRGYSHYPCASTDM